MAVLLVDELIPEAIFLAKMACYCAHDATHLALWTQRRDCHSERKKSCRRDVECAQASARGRKRERNRWIEK